MTAFKRECNSKVGKQAFFAKNVNPKDISLTYFRYENVCQKIFGFKSRVVSHKNFRCILWMASDVCSRNFQQEYQYLVCSIAQQQNIYLYLLYSICYIGIQYTSRQQGELESSLLALLLELPTKTWLLRLSQACIVTVAACQWHFCAIPDVLLQFQAVRCRGRGSGIIYESFTGKR